MLLQHLQITFDNLFVCFEKHCQLFYHASFKDWLSLRQASLSIIQFFPHITLSLYIYKILSCTFLYLSFSIFQHSHIYVNCETFTHPTDKMESNGRSEALTLSPYGSANYLLNCRHRCLNWCLMHVYYTKLLALCPAECQWRSS